MACSNGIIAMNSAFFLAIGSCTAKCAKMENAFVVQENFRVPPETIYRAWLDSRSHSAMTGGDAVCSNKVGGTFSAWDGYISGRNIRLEEGREIVQAWRTTDFAEEDNDSLLTIKFYEIPDGCMVEIIHEDIPAVDADFLTGWQDYYFSPMQSYFSRL